MEAWRKLSQDQLVFSLPLYRKVEIDWNNMKEETIESEYYSNLSQLYDIKVMKIPIDLVIISSTLPLTV